MRKILNRLIIFFVGLPLLLSLIIFFPQQNHLLLNIVITVFSVLGAVEFRNILVHKNLVISIPEAVMLGAISPVAWILAVNFGITENIVPAAFVLGALWLLVSRVFTNHGKLDSCINSITAGFAVLIYPGVFAAWIIRMALFPQASFVILIFFLVALLNDSLAWFTGVLFGKNNRGFVAASPNKSIAGFTGGLVFSVISGITAALLFPDAFSSTLMHSTLAGALLGLVAGLAATLGDLAESAIKRSAGVKDSGSFVIGRGGALDSIDSVALAAPVYYLMYQFLFIT